MFTALFLVISLLGSIAPGIATAQDAGTPAPVVTEEPAAQTGEQPAAEQPAPEAPVEQPAQGAPPVEQPAQEAPPVEPAAEQPAEEAAPAEAVVEQPVDETSTVMTEVAPEPVEVAAAPVSCQVAEGVSPWIASDLADYPPGAWVSLSGGNWASGQTIEIFVDDDGVADAEMGEWSHFTTVTADVSGAFTYGFNLPEWFVANYFVTATGECSQASTTFTDAQVATAAISPSTTEVGKQATFTVTITNTSTSNSQTDRMTSATIQVPASFDTVSVSAPTGWSASVQADGSTLLSGPAALTRNQSLAVQVSAKANSVGNGFVWTTAAVNSAGVAFNFGTNQPSVNVTAPACTAPQISQHPSTQSVTFESNATFTASASGSPAPTVQWQVSTDSGTSWSDAPGAIDTTVTVVNPSFSQSGSQYRAVFTNDCGGTKTATTSAATLTVTPKTVTITPDGGLSKTYGTAADPSLTFSNDAGLALSAFDGALDREPGEAAGTYEINLGDLSAGSNYILTLTSTVVTFEITKASQAITSISVPESPRVDGTYKPSATGGGSGNAVTFGASGACSFADGTVTFDAAGECVLTANQAGNDNYHAAPQVEQSFTIGKGTAEITLDGLRHTYDGTPKFATATNSKGLVVTFTYAQGENAVEEPVNAGEYTVTATIEDANYEGSITGTLTIEQAKVNVTIANQTMVYNGTSPELTFGNSARLPAGDFSGGLKIDGDPASGVGFYPIVPDGLAVTNGNYKLGTVTDGTLEVTPAPVILVIDTDSLSQTYTGTALEIGFQTDPAGLEGSIALEYRLNGVGDAIDPVNAGSYSVTARITDANYELDFEGTRLTIEKQAVTVSVSDPAPTYDGARKDASVSGAPDGVQVELAYSRDGEIVADPIGAGTYDVAATVKDANYEGTATGTLTIKQAEVTIKIEDKTKIYGAEDPAFTSSITDGNLAGNDTASGKFTREAGEDVREGGYAITGGDLSLGNNYKLTVNPGILTITKAEQKIGFEAIGPKTYGDSSVTLSANASSGLDVSFAAKDGSACTVSGTTVTLTGAGSCTVVASQAGDGNYNAAPDAEQTFAIERKVVTPVLGDLTHTYDGKAKEATVKLPDGVTGTVTITYNGLPTAPVSAGSYPVEAKLEGANHGGSVKGTLEIKKASWTVKGFYQPIDMGGAVNTAKGGSTVPVKFEVFQGNTEITDVSQVTVKIVRLSSCAAAGGDEVTLEQTTTGGTSLRYEGGQFVYNFKTDKAAGTCYKLTVEATSVNLNATVNGSQEAYIKTK